ncbi:MAG: MFS transporter [Candidatus Dormibacteria bacterium]
MSTEKKVGVVDAEGYTAPPSATGGAASLLKSAASWGALARSPYGILPLVMLSLLTIGGILQDSVFAVGGPNIAQDLNLDLRTIGGIVSIVGFFSIGGSLGVGWLADRVPRKPLVAGGAIAAAAMSMLQSRAVNTNTYAAPRVGASLAAEVNQIPGGSLLADWYPIGVRGRVFAVLGIIGSAGAVFTSSIIGVMIVQHGWRSVVVATAAPALVVGVLFLFLKEPVRGYFERHAMGLSEEAALRPDPPQSFGEAFRTTWAVRTVRRLFMADIILGVAGIPFGVFLNFLLADQYGFNAAQRGFFFLPYGVATIIGGLLGGGLIDALGRRSPNSVLRIVGVFFFIALAGLAGVAFIPPLPVLLALVCLVGFGLSISGPGLQSIYSQVIPPSVRTQGLQFSNLARIPGLLAIGIFTTVQFNYGYGPTFLMAVPLLLLAGLVVISAADFFENDRRNAGLAAAATEEARKLAAEGKGKLLICRGINVFYGGNQVLFNVDIDVEEGEIVALLGTNGAGKSTLLRAISGTQEAADGAIIVDGRDITHMPPHEVAGRGVVHMPGGKGVFPGLTVEENIRLGTWMAESAQVGRLIQDAYELFPVLKTRRTQLAGLLSGGEQQMLALAQAFMARPRLLMIDELSLGLAPAVVGELLEKVKEIHRRGTTVIVVEQSVNVALNLAKRAIFMEKGEVKFAGPTEELLRRPDILRAVYVKGTGSLSAPGTGTATRTHGIKPGANNVLEVRQLTKRFGGITALDKVNLRLREGEILGIVGPNGSGKTTLFDVISGYQAPDEGQIFFAGNDITTMSPDERARLKLIRRFQDARLFPALTVFESLLVALDQRMEVRNAALGAIQLPAARRAERLTRVRADRLLELLELGNYRDKFVKELSTGLRRIVDLAFVLATEPKVLLLDEPSSGMAQSEAEGLAPLLTRVRYETGCSILIIEHDMPLISAVSDELMALVNGSVVMQGSTTEVLNDQRLVEAFLGGSEAAIQRSGRLA